jgi:hypothetical protein
LLKCRRRNHTGGGREGTLREKRDAGSTNREEIREKGVGGAAENAYHVRGWNVLLLALLQSNLVETLPHQIQECSIHSCCQAFFHLRPK